MKSKSKSKSKSKKNIITIQARDGIVCLNGFASESASIYIELIVEACKRRKIDPRDAIINTDSYPQLNKTAEVEFAIGWLHGLAEAHELLAEQVFDAIKVGDVEEIDDDEDEDEDDDEDGDDEPKYRIAGKKRPAQKVTRTRRAA
jgi:hypothetical protein